jgi:excinuclease ABC subunit C
MRIPGVGPVKRRQLLQRFGSVQGVRDARPEDIADLPGFTVDGARRLLDSLGVPSPTPDESSPPPEEPSPSPAAEEGA